MSNNGRVLSDLDVKLTRYLEAKVQGFTAWDEVEKRSLSTAAPKQSSADPRCEVGILVQSMLNPN